MNEIRVKVTKFSDRRYLLMYYDCPRTGKRVSRSTKQTTEREAVREAGKWEAELREGRYKPASKIAWAEFRQRYEDEVAAGLAHKTDRMVGTVFNTVERILPAVADGRLVDLDVDQLSDLQKQLRNEKRSEATIRSYFAHLRAALRWAVDLKMLPAVPKIMLAGRAKDASTMKGRPIKAEEFDRLLAKVEAGLIAASDAQNKRRERKRTLTAEQAAKARRKQTERAAIAAPDWHRLLNGLWLSGLRLGEALNLYWDRDDKLTISLDRRRPMLFIPAALDKGRKDRELPIAPEFAEFLAETPREARTGPVFPLRTLRGPMFPNGDWVSRVICQIGQAAGVKVNTSARTGKTKFASAHDLRRSFGARWSARVMPAVLKELMRHESIDTTMRFYVGQNAEATADAIWAAADKVILPPAVKGGPLANANASSAHC